MDARELRIGNIVDAPIDGHCEILSFVKDILNFKNNVWSVEVCKPIPLTEEWFPVFRDVNIFWSNFSKDKDGYFLWVGGYKVYIKHVHQLQNLYFALTGKELEIIKTK